MAEIKLVPKGKIGITVEAEVIRPDAFARMSKEEIERAAGLARAERASSERVL